MASNMAGCREAGKRRGDEADLRPDGEGGQESWFADDEGLLGAELLAISGGQGDAESSYRPSGETDPALRGCGLFLPFFPSILKSSGRADPVDRSGDIPIRWENNKN